MEYENMRLLELKAITRDRRLRSYSQMRKAEFVALLHTSTPPQRCVTLKFDDNGSCRIHSVSDGDKEIVPNERYFVMPWKIVNVDGKRVSLKEAVDKIFNNQNELTPRTQPLSYMTKVFAGFTLFLTETKK